MKRILLSSIFALLSMASVTAQDVQLSSDFVHFNFENVDISGVVDLYDYLGVTNNTDEVLELKWERIVVTDITPPEWLSQICDNYQCYAFNSSTNYDASIGLTDTSFVLQPGETYSEFALHVWPSSVPGCGQYKVRFSRIQEPEEILAVAHFDISVNTPDCNFLSSTNEKETASNVALYPNPTHGHFTLTPNPVVKKVAIYNILGKVVQKTDYFEGDQIDVSDLTDGMYLVGLQNENGQTLKTLRLSKRNSRP